MTFHPLMKSVAAGALLGLLAIAPAKAEEVVLKAVTAFPSSLDFAQSFLRFVDKVNEEGKGVVKIQYMGGPEVVPPPQQAQAVRRGVIDMQYGPGTYYLGDMPEVDAWVGSTVNAMEARANGGFEIMQKVYEDKLGAYLLAHIDTGVDFHIYLTEEPKRTEDGGIDLSGLKLRSQPIYREFFDALGATSVSVPVPEVYTALERGVVDGVGWPLVGIQDLSWDKFLKYRVDPAFFQTDLCIIMNVDKWAGLSDEAKAILTKVATEHEQSSFDHYQTVIEETDKAVQEAGMQVIDITGDARQEYLEMAFETAWSRLKSSGSDQFDALRAAYYDR
ncbi:TRAP transporter substrate-binding protein DctP [Amorphus coralli]|uniref:TRAP transporter substrate-binding protein DctP n=1 Tax=Amorphus coralli TaxID=340680 RepID=UPI00035C1B5B|nr:TRAP transporter substrate-binding protein DctP [Amorphus coralli]